MVFNKPSTSTLNLEKAIAEIDEVPRTKGTFFTDFLRLFNKNFQKLSAVFARFQSAEKLTVSPCS